MKEPNRREFLGGLLAASTSALWCGQGGLDLDPCAQVKLSDIYRRKRAAGTLSVSFLGTFAIFVSQSSIEAYAPNIVDNLKKPLHNYWLSKPVPGKSETSDYVFDLAVPNKIDGIVGTGSVPKFMSKQPDLKNNVDDQLSLVLPRMSPPTQGFLHKISLPLPDDIVLGLFSQKRGSDRIFTNQADFCWIAREHLFIYESGRFDQSKLKFNNKPISFDSGEDLSLRILSEPKDDNLMAQECVAKDHVQRAMQGLGQMLGKGQDAFKINVPYCNQLVPPSPLMASTTARDFDGVGAGQGDGAVSASRYPACQSVLINNI